MAWEWLLGSFGLPEGSWIKCTDTWTVGWIWVIDDHMCGQAKSCLDGDQYEGDFVNSKDSGW